MSKTLTTTELAEVIGTSPKTLRKFLRSDARDAGQGDSLPGKGARYAIPASKVKGLKSRYAKWAAAEAAARAERATKAAAEAEAQVEQGDEDEVEVELDD